MRCAASRGDNLEPVRRRGEKSDRRVPGLARKPRKQLTGVGMQPFDNNVTVYGQNPAPPKRPWQNDSPVLPTNNGFPWVQSGAGFCPSTVVIVQPCIQPKNKARVVKGGHQASREELPATEKPEGSASHQGHPPKKGCDWGHVSLLWDSFGRQRTRGRPLSTWRIKSRRACLKMSKIDPNK